MNREGLLLGAGLGALVLVPAAVALRRAKLELARQRRLLRELALLNEISQAIIHSEPEVGTLCELIYREASKLLDTAVFHLGLFDAKHYSFIVQVQDGVRLPALTVDLTAEVGLLGWLRQTGQALLVEDFTIAQVPARPQSPNERPPRAGLYVPLLTGDHVLGIIAVESDQPGAFGANDLRLLTLLADQAAVAIMRASAFRKANVRAVQLQAIQQVSERITAILDLDLLLPAVVRLIHEHFGFHPVHIFTLTPNDPRIYFRASTATGEQLDQVRALSLMLGQGLVGSAVLRGAPILVSDVQREPRYIRDDQHTRSELAVPLRVGEQVVGILDVQSDAIDAFDADDLFVLHTLADQIAVAIDSANSYRAQQEEAWTLNALLQVAEQLSRVTHITDLVAVAVRLPAQLIGAPRASLLVWDQTAEQFTCEAVHGLDSSREADLVGQLVGPEAVPLVDALRQAVADGRRLIRVPHPHLVLAGASSSLIVLPLVGRMGLLGALVLDYDEEPHLSERQRNLCVGTAGQVAGALENLLLAHEAEAAAQFEQELRVAREIQTTLLPANPPQLPGWAIDATWRSAHLVGGDFFDFWPLPVKRAALTSAAVGDEHGTDAVASGAHAAAELGFVIADVSDKGVPAALFMAMARSLVRAAALDGAPPAQAIEQANRWLTRDSESGMFVTLFYGVLEPQSGRLRYTVAGHNPPLHYRAATGTLVELHTPGIALGVLEAITLGEATTVLAPGDVLVCYTDGVTETINETSEEFGVARLRALVIEQQSAPVAMLLQAIIAAVNQHGHGQPPFDDVTLVVLKRELMREA